MINLFYSNRNYVEHTFQNSRTTPTTPIQRKYKKKEKETPSYHHRSRRNAHKTFIMANMKIAVTLIDGSCVAAAAAAAVVAAALISGLFHTTKK